MVKKSIIRKPIKSTLYVRDISTKTKCLFKVWCARRNVSMAYALEKVLEKLVKSEKTVYSDLSNLGEVIDVQEFDEDFDREANNPDAGILPEGDGL